MLYKGQRVRIKEFLNDGIPMNSDEVDEFLDGNLSLNTVFNDDIKGTIQEILSSKYHSTLTYRVLFDNGYDTIWGFDENELELLFDEKDFIKYCGGKNGKV